MPALILTILLIPLFWVLIVRPQQQRQRAHRDFVAALAPGDRIEAFSGIRGTITEVHDTTVRVEIAPTVVVTMARLAIASLVEEFDGADDDEDVFDGQRDVEDTVIPSQATSVDRTDQTEGHPS